MELASAVAVSRLGVPRLVRSCRACTVWDSVLLLVPVCVGDPHVVHHLVRVRGDRQMNAGVDGVALSVFVFFFVLITVIGFLAARWQRGDLDLIGEWGLAGRRFGTTITWFLLGGDLYTAYTMIAVPAAVFGTGAAGFFALPYTIVAYPFFFLAMPRLWNVCKRHSFVTPADFVEGRYGDRRLALAIAITGILATLPYIALQLVGIQ